MGRVEIRLIRFIYCSPTNNKSLIAKSTKRVSNAIKQAVDIFWLEVTSIIRRLLGKRICRRKNIHLTPFINTIQGHFFIQHVTEPTRYRHGEQPNLLDLILTNEEGMVQNLTYHHGLGDSNHCHMKFNLYCYAHYSSTTEKSINYYKANYIAIKDQLQKMNRDETLRRITQNSLRN